MAQGERTVEVLANRTGVSIANASQHLQQMRRAGLVTSRRDGKYIYYRLTDDSVLDVLAAIRVIAERNVAEVDRVVRSYFNDRDSPRSGVPQGIGAAYSHGNRDRNSTFAPRTSSHWGICQVPSISRCALLKGRLSELDPKQEIIAYCRGPYCVMSYEAVAMLRAKGFKVRRLEDGLPEWRAAGLPVVTEGK